jgi:sugar lactone lactonase YvrE
MVILPIIPGVFGTNFFYPRGVTVDTSGYVYVADTNSNRIRKITPAGVVSTLAGGTSLAGADNGTGGTAKFSTPSGVALDTSGNVYVADTFNQSIRKISSAGVVSHLAGVSGSNGYVDGSGTTAKFNTPIGVAVDSSGFVYVSDNDGHLIRKISTTGVVSIFAGVASTAGYVDGTGGTAKFNKPAGIAFDSNDNLYVVEQNNLVIRKITPTGIVSTFAGSGARGSANGTGRTASFNNPIGVAIDHGGNFYVTDNSNHLIRKINPAGEVSTLAGVASIAGYADGLGETANFNYPYGVALDSSGVLYVADSSNNLIRKITPIYV